MRNFNSQGKTRALATIYNLPQVEPNIDNFRYTISTTRPRASSGGDLLDLVLVSRQMASRIQYCDVGDNIGSNHMLVHLTLSLSKYSKTTSAIIFTV